MVTVSSCSTREGKTFERIQAAQLEALLGRAAELQHVALRNVLDIATGEPNLCMLRFHVCVFPAHTAVPRSATRCEQLVIVRFVESDAQPRTSHVGGLTAYLYGLPRHA